MKRFPGRTQGKGKRSKESVQNKKTVENFQERVTRPNFDVYMYRCQGLKLFELILSDNVMVIVGFSVRSICSCKDSCSGTTLHLVLHT